MDSYILFIDSGIGGISILDRLLEKRSDLNVIFYADAEHFPYGGKDEVTIGSYLYNIYEEMKVRFKIELIVIACNTASVSALDYLRSRVTIPIVGTVPAVKVASEMSKTGKIGIIATETTVKLNYLGNLIKKFASDKEVIIKAAPGLVSAVEGFYGEVQLDGVVVDELSSFLDVGIDCFVLGCTHYSFVKDKINDFFGGRVNVIDSCDGVSNRVLSLLPSGVINSEPEKILFVSDKSVKPRYEELNKKMKIFKTIYYKDKVWQKG